MVAYCLINDLLFCLFVSLLQVGTFVHTLHDAKQEWFTVFGVVCDLNKRIKEMGSSITEVSLHSDNDGYYHCAGLILNLQNPARF